MSQNGVCVMRKPSACKGVWFRADVSWYPTARGCNQRVRLRELRQRRCPGCPECEEIRRRVSLLGRGGAWVEPQTIVQHGRVYRLKLLNKGESYVY